jgi:serine/threonine-protein kinase
MPFVEGDSLRDRLQREAQLPLADALRIAGEVADALAYAHAHDIVHRDIKPENILFSGGHAVVADFGIARAISSAAYMSPEQASGDPQLDGRSDVYSLGCVLCEMLAGQIPFAGPTPQAIMVRRLLEPVPPLRSLRDTVPEGVECAVTRALARAPADRFRTAAELRDALQAAVAPEPSGPVAARAGPPAPPAHSIAVLPLVNMSSERDNEYFSDGMTEELINVLAKIPGLRVAARTSAFAFKGKDQDVRRVGEQLGVATVLEGSVRRAGPRMRLTAQLINVADGYHLWSETYDREVADVFAVQDEIARTIVGALRVRLTGGADATLVQPQTADIEAYQLYLKGRYFWNKRTHENFWKAVELFQAAVRRDPDYALAYSGLADAYQSLGLSLVTGSVAPNEVQPRARAAALKALEIDEGLAEGHTSLACAKLTFDWDVPGAEREFRRAIELNPSYGHAHHWYSHALVSTRRFDESLAESRRALELESLSLVMNAHLGWHYFYARRFDDAIAQLHATLEMDPNWAYALYYLGLSYEQKGMYDEAADALRRALAVLPGALALQTDLGHVLAAAGRPGEARATLEALRARAASGYVPSFYFARLHEALGQTDQAFEALHLATEERFDHMLALGVDPRWDPLRSDPRFSALLDRVGIERGVAVR